MCIRDRGSDALRSGKESPGTRAKQMSMLRQKFIEAKAYQEKVAKAAADEEKDAPARDLRKEAMGQILDGKMPLMINAHSSVDIQNVLRLQKEWQIPVILQGGGGVLRLHRAAEGAGDSGDSASDDDAFFRGRQECQHGDRCQVDRCGSTGRDGQWLRILRSQNPRGSLGSGHRLCVWL